MLIKRPEAVKPSDITDRGDYITRRRFIESIAGTSAAVSLLQPGGVVAMSRSPEPSPRGAKLEGVIKSRYSTDEVPNTYEEITTHNNFYEFGTGKGDPARRAGAFKPIPWKVAVQGECDNPGSYDIEDFLSPGQLEERIYRLRCVETWTMVVPWVGVPLGPILSRFAPTSRAKYVVFRTVFRPSEMPGQHDAYFEWPYTEGLRIDEAMHPLTILAVGLYGEVIPNQNGAPMRLIVPWKYGFKSIKSIVAIEFSEHQPSTTWNKSQPDEYGFYANVNPEVDHPRWSQKRERRIGEFGKRETLMLNGYADQVGSLYAGMDLAKHF